MLTIFEYEVKIALISGIFLYIYWKIMLFMDKNQIIAEILKEIDAVKSIAIHIRDASSPPQLDLDLAVSKLRSVYDHFLQLKDVKQDNEPVVAAETPAESPKPEKVMPAVEESTETIEEPATEEIENKEKETAAETEETAREENLETEPPPEKKSKILADKYEKPDTSLNEAIAGNIKDLATKFRNRPIPSIKYAVSLNDKIGIIRELFDNDKEKYIQTVEHLDKLSSLDEALEYINAGFDWDPEKPEFNKLLELLYRRFVTLENSQ